MYSFILAPCEYNIFSAMKQNLGFHKIKKLLRGGNRCDILGGHKTRIAITTEQMWHTGWTQDTDCYHHGTKYSSHDTTASVVARTMPKSNRITQQLNPNSSCSVGQDSVVGLATRYGLDGPGIECPWGRDFPHSFRTALGHIVCCSMGIWHIPRG